MSLVFAFISISDWGSQSVIHQSQTRPRQPLICFSVPRPRPAPPPASSALLLSPLTFPLPTSLPASPLPVPASTPPSLPLPLLVLPPQPRERAVVLIATFFSLGSPSFSHPVQFTQCTNVNDQNLFVLHSPFSHLVAHLLELFLSHLLLFLHLLQPLLLCFLILLNTKTCKLTTICSPENKKLQ